MHALLWLGLALFAVALVLAAVVALSSRLCGQPEDPAAAEDHTGPLSEHAPLLQHTHVTGAHSSQQVYSAGRLSPHTSLQDVTCASAASSTASGPAPSCIRIMDRKYWIPDAYAPACAGCATLFSFFRRRHHCRLCGHVFCSQCSQARLDGSLFGSEAALRACRPCADAFVAALSAPHGREQLQDMTPAPSRPVSPVYLPADPTAAAAAPAAARADSAADGPAPSRPTLRRSGRSTPSLIESKAQSLLRTRGARTDSQTRLIGMLSSGRPSLDPDASPPFPNSTTSDLGPNQGDDIQDALRAYLADWDARAGSVDSDDTSNSDGNRSGDSELSAHLSSSDDLSVVSVASLHSSPPDGDHPVSHIHLIGASDLSKNVNVMSAATTLPSGDSDVWFDASLPLRHSDSMARAPRRALSGLSASSPDLFLEDRVRRDQDANLASVYDAHSHALVGQSLADANLPPEWADTIVPLALTAVRFVLPSLRTGEDLDARAYVRIECVPGGVMAESRLIEGVVCFKHVAHKHMATHITSPSLLVLDTNIEHAFLGSTSRIATFDSLVVQEEEYLRLVVEKMLDVHPDVVVVSGTVSRLARNMLLDRGVTLVPAVGPEMCARLARQTGAVVLTSVDAIRGDASILGACAEFRAESLTAVQSRSGVRPMLVFDGTPPSRGVTLLVRGDAPIDDLDVVLDAVVQLAITAAANRIFEMSLLHDEYAMFNDTDAASAADAAVDTDAASAAAAADDDAASTETDVTSTDTAVPASVSDDKLDATVRRSHHNRGLSQSATPQAIAFARRVLSMTPSMTIPPVYTEEHPSASLILPRMQRQALRSSPAAEHSDAAVDRTMSSHNLASGAGPADTDAVLRLHSDLATTDNRDEASPFDFQSLCVLFMTMSDGQARPCCIPHAQVIEFYQDSDMTLGQYLDVCFDLSNTCRQHTCQRDMLAHVCTYAHNKGAVAVRVDQMPSALPGAEPDALLMWSCCKVCDTLSPIRRVSSDTWMLSFGKYLESTFYPPNVVLAGSSSCRHNIHHNHIRYFAKGPLLLSFEYSSVPVFAISPPGTELAFAPGASGRVINSERVDLLARLESVVHGDHLVDHDMSAFDALTQELQNVRTRAELNVAYTSLVRLAMASAAVPEVAAKAALVTPPDSDGGGGGGGGGSSALATSPAQYIEDVLRVWSLDHMHFAPLGAGAPRPGIGPYPIVDDEPTSIIGFALASESYAAQLESYGYSLSTAGDEATDARVLMDAPHSRVDIEVTSRDFTFSCKAYYAVPFHAVRAKYARGEQGILESLARCVPWAATGGKSASEFLKTRDDRLILKEVQKVEMGAFLSFAPSYFEYMMRVLYDDVPSLLVKFLGLYRVEIDCKSKGIKYRKYVVLMENLFFQKRVDAVFDLKGSERSRYIKSPQPGEVCLDLNLVELIWQNPLYVREHSKVYLYSALCNDSLFLASLRVMDYSLLLGIDYESGVLTVGIIDYIRRYTWDKHLESWVKSTGILGGGGKRPTVISPQEYKTRFRRAMNRYFAVVPDHHAGRLGRQ